MEFIVGLLAVIAVASSILLTVVILLQEPKGGGLAGARGGSGMEAIGGSRGSVNKFTSIVAAVGVAACLLHAVLMASTTIVAPNGANTPADTE